MGGALPGRDWRLRHHATRGTSCSSKAEYNLLLYSNRRRIADCEQNIGRKKKWAFLKLALPLSQQRESQPRPALQKQGMKGRKYGRDKALAIMFLCKLQKEDQRCLAVALASGG
jgi:hypothetical protein